jgi:iron(II)-dependent oxidoreductase
MPNQPPPREGARQLLSNLAQARTMTDELFGIVRPEALYARPIAERHRIAFYIGHLEAFDWNLVGKYVLGLKPFDESFDQLFAFGIDPVGGGLPTDQPSDWPRIAEIHNYNRRLRGTLDAALDKLSFNDSRQPLLHGGYVLNVALEHRLMHAETLAYMFHQLPLDQKASCRALPGADGHQVKPRMMEIPAGAATLGLPRAEHGHFGWDNEFEAHTENVPAFAIDSHKITNRQWLEFMAAGGYEDSKYWAPSDWEWKAQQGISHPVFWQRRSEQWLHRSMFAEIPLPGDWPVYVSQAEASAYIRWAGKVLPTEAQWHRAAFGTPKGPEREYPWGDEAPSAGCGNFDFHQWDPTPAGAFPAGRSAFGVADMLGNGWEWTSTLFEPFAGFQAFPFYPGYSANFFDGKHYVMKGGSSRTAAALLRRSFRNWFQGHYQYVYAGFRCVEN